MVDPVTAGIVVGFLVDKVGGTAVEKYTESAIAKINGLWDRAWERLRGNPKVEKARQALEANEPAAPESLQRYFLNVMEDDEEFQGLIEAIAAEIQAGEKAASDGVTVTVSGQAKANVWSNPGNKGKIYQADQIIINEPPDT